MELIRLNDVNSKIVTVRGQNVILDSDVAELYGVETKAVNQAVKRNLDKFPDGYIFLLSENEKTEVVTNCDHLKKLKFSPELPKAFTEKGLYMLATILKSPQAIQTTIAIIEVFTKIRELSREVVELVKDHENQQRQNAIKQKSSKVLSDIIGADLETVGTETSFELNLLAAIKVKHTIKRGKKSKQ
ncbi:MAG: ORF6N domain-containing protein [Bacteroidales bacterium]|jgi:phage regulator Rha-like protein|nr:ORF6N domain-containing protein [Bacteroidales bacterium]